MIKSDSNEWPFPDLSSIEKLRLWVRRELALKGMSFIEPNSWLGWYFLHAAERGNPEKIKVFVEEGFPLDFQDHQTGETALHIVAAGRARKALRELLKSDKLDFLIRDNQGRLASEIAYLYGRDPAVARLLRIKERKQAAAQGIKLTRRPT